MLLSMIYLHKILPLLISPLGLIVGLMVLSLVLRRLWPTCLALFTTLFCSFSVTADLIWNGLESDYPYKSIEQADKRDAVLVLSGMLSGFKTEHGFVTQWEDPDRFFAGIDLVKSGKSDRIIFTRGLLPWADGPPEGELLRLKAIELGVKESQIYLTDVAVNTADEAKATKKLMEQKGLQNILLVTSSSHMPRSKRLFDKAGIKSEAYPTDFRAKQHLSWLHFIPSAEAFKDTSSGIREYIGRLYYWIKYS